MRVCATTFFIGAGQRLKKNFKRALPLLSRRWITLYVRNKKSSQTVTLDCSVIYLHYVHYDYTTYKNGGQVHNKIIFVKFISQFA